MSDGPYGPTRASTFASVQVGAEMMIWCEGGPAMLRREQFPPPVELKVEGGIYVLHDDGEPADWRYVFIAP